MPPKRTALIPAAAARKKPSNNKESGSKKGGNIKKPCPRTERKDPTIDSKMESNVDDGKEEDINTNDNRNKWARNFLQSVQVKALSKEFIANKSYKPDGATFEECKKHEDFNRYHDILCMDQSRVVLKDRPDSDNYIHASWIETVDKSQKYICTQGPLKETAEHFWHMIYAEKCRVVVMVCDLNEGGNEKCYQYWPIKSDITDTYGQFTIRIDSTPEKTPHSAVKYQIIKCEGKDGSLLVHHYWIPTWVDHIAPIDPEPVVAMYRSAVEKAEKTPIVVHCSAGIGRSGSFAALDFASSMIKANPDTSMTKMLKDLRGQRFHAIQSYIQYNFLHLCILESFVQDKVLARKGAYTKFMKEYRGMVNKYNEKLVQKKGEEGEGKKNKKQKAEKSS